MIVEVDAASSSVNRVRHFQNQLHCQTQCQFNTKSTQFKLLNLQKLVLSMVWPFSSSKDEDPPSSNTDPLRDLDPSLRAFLEKESPIKYKRSENPPPPPPPDHAPRLSTSEPQLPSQSTSPSSESSPSPPDKHVPPQSLYPDGRYASLWSTYQPLHDVESAHRSDQEKLLDIIEGYKERKAQIGRAALENCAMEQWAVNDCFTNGGWASRMTMCRAENRGLERCYMMQSVCSSSDRCAVQEY